MDTYFIDMDTYLITATLCNRALWHAIIFLPCGFFYLLSFMAALCNRAGHIYFHPVVSSFFFFLA